MVIMMLDVISKVSMALDVLPEVIIWLFDVMLELEVLLLEYRCFCSYITA